MYRGFPKEKERQRQYKNEHKEEIGRYQYRCNQERYHTIKDWYNENLKKL